MPLHYDNLRNHVFPERTQTYTEKDVMLYALGLGFGFDPLDKKQLRFVYEKDLVALPSMAAILCYPGNWLRNPDTGVNYTRVMNGGTRFVIHRPLPTQANFVLIEFRGALTAEAAYLGLMEYGYITRWLPGQGLPQALRIIVPPLTSQYLNLLKNSSLAIAIGYPDLVNVANTTINITGQAIEGIAIVMAVFVAISLALSLLMNWYNRRITLVAR